MDSKLVPDLIIRTGGDQRLSNFCYGKLLILIFILLIHCGQILVRSSLTRL
ncbi:MAG: hypothetical protein HC932_03705 [Thermales bacterium]|nr:hypothetical protein [Thermales bacterium]